MTMRELAGVSARWVKTPSNGSPWSWDVHHHRQGGRCYYVLAKRQAFRREAASD